MGQETPQSPTGVEAVMMPGPCCCWYQHAMMHRGRCQRRKKRNETRGGPDRGSAERGFFSLHQLDGGFRQNRTRTRALNGAFRRHNSSPLLVFGGRSNQQRHRRAGKENKTAHLDERRCRGDGAPSRCVTSEWPDIKGVDERTGGSSFFPLAVFRASRENVKR